jgi:hypothetical protein
MRYSPDQAHLKFSKNDRLRARLYTNTRGTQDEHNRNTMVDILIAGPEKAK